MDFAILPPEINSGRMYIGPGSGPMLAAAAAWGTLATELLSAAASYGSTIETLTVGPWTGPSSIAMAAAVAPYVTWLGTAASQAEQTAAQAKVAADAYEVAFAATVPPPVIAANRALLMQLEATNLFGQNTPAIMAAEAHYAEMWAQDAAAMYGYAGASAAATTLTPFTPPPQSAGGLGGQAAALAQAAATSAATNTQARLAQVTSAVPAALNALAAPMSSTSAAGLPVIPQNLAGILQALGMSLLSPSTILEPTDVGIASSELTTASGAWASASQGDEEILQNNRDAASEISNEQDLLTGRLSGMENRIMSRFNQLGAAGSAASAGLGQAAPVGALSVPPGWTTVAPEIRLTAAALPTTTLGAAPEVCAGGSETMFGEMVLTSMAGRALCGTVNPGGRERIGATPRACPAPSPKSPGGFVTGIAEMREVTELLGKLGSLRDSGILTSSEFNEQKRRLLGAIPVSI
jgi:PPE-repeat protein